MKTIPEFCATHHACAAGREWAMDNCGSMLDAWRTARPEWVVWIATRPGVMTHRECVQFALWCAEQCARPGEDARVTACRDTVRRWLEGKATGDECVSAAYAAYVAAYAAASAAVAARDAAAAYAAYAAASAATSDATSDAAVAAARAAAYAAYVAAYAAARSACLQKQADWLRANITPNFE